MIHQGVVLKKSDFRFRSPKRHFHLTPISHLSPTKEMQSSKFPVFFNDNRYASAIISIFSGGALTTAMFK